MQVTFKIDADALAAYTAANGTSYQMYPTDKLSLENGGVVTIATGSKRSESLELAINPGGTVGASYAVAISATAGNGVEVSSNTQSYIYLVENLGVTPDPATKGDIKNLVYVEVNNESPLNAGEYMVDGVPFFDIVSIFAANINLDSDGMLEKNALVNMIRCLLYWLIPIRLSVRCSKKVSRFTYLSWVITMMPVCVV